MSDFPANMGGASNFYNGDLMILVAGSANLDFVVRADHIPGPGETVMGREFQTYPGGKGANQAVACSRAGGAKTHMLLGLGADAFAQPLVDSLNSAKVELHIVRTPDHPTGTAFICVSDDAENAITVAPGANAGLQPAHLPALEGFTYLLMQLETPLETVMAFAKAAHAQGVTVVLNAAPAQALPAELLANIDILVVNEGELAAIAGHTGSVSDALAMINVPCVVVTLGSAGCCARIHQSGSPQLIKQAAFPIEPIDTTGAGDTFCGVLVAALSQGHALTEAMRLASAAGAMACLTPGAQSSIPTHEALQTFLDRHKTRSSQTQFQP